MLSVTLFAFFAFFEVVKCGDNMHGGFWFRRHNSNVDIVQRNTALEKRYDGARLTNYAAGLGACGVVNIATDFVSFSLYEYLSWQLNDYVDCCSQYTCKTRVILFGC